MRKKSNLMRRVEREFKMPIEQLLRQRLAAGITMERMASDFDVSYWTIRNWCREYQLSGYAPSEKAAMP
jgi:transposase-like protein